MSCVTFTIKIRCANHSPRAHAASPEAFHAPSTIHYAGVSAAMPHDDAFAARDAAMRDAETDYTSEAFYAIRQLMLIIRQRAACHASAAAMPCVLYARRCR